MKNAPRPRKPSAACFEPSEASETFSGAFLSFPTRRKRSAARFDTFRGVRASAACVGAYRIRPPGAPTRGEYTSPGMFIHPLRDVWRAYSIRPYRGTCIRYVRRVRAFVTVIRAHGPVWGAYSIRPYRATCIRPVGRGRFTALPKAGPPGGMLWASSRRPTRGERRWRRRGLRAARSAGC